MRKLFAVFIILFFYTGLSAQNKLLVAEGTPPNLYISHFVVAKENYYSVGRMYNVSPKELAPYNSLVFEKGLALGSTIKIPLSVNNFSQGETAKDNEVLVPVYHVMQPKEGLYRVSLNYNKIPLDALKNWNKLSGDAIGTGTKIIIGFLKVLKDQSPLASQAMRISPTEVAVKIPAEKKEEVKEEKVEAPKKEMPVKTIEPEPKQTTPVIENTNDAVAAGNKSGINFSGGKFKSLYNDQTKNKSLSTESGTAVTFKTTSGWQDGKYYCFHNTALPGTIIKITNSVNGKSVYAKVLDAIPDIKQNMGLLLRISNSAAEELGAGEKFDCSISYSK